MHERAMENKNFAYSRPPKAIYKIYLNIDFHIVFNTGMRGFTKYPASQGFLDLISEFSQTF